jgi:excinuclease UvrABC nuclease subunit
MPDLVVIDGGKGQLSAALKGMAKANVFPEKRSLQKTSSSLDFSAGAGDKVFINEEQYPLMQPESQRHATVPVVALAKNKEEVYVHKVSNPVNDTPDSPALLLLRALRDESHRFALTAHRRRRSKLNGL